MVNSIKSFLTFMCEEKSVASQGIIFDGDKKAYVGAHHTKAIQLSDDLKEKVLRLIDKYGIWYEGAGGDIKPNVKLFGNKSSYEGSWDDEFAKSVKGYPIEFMIVMFGNVKENKTIAHYTSPNMTIFKSLLKHQDGKKFFKDRSYNETDLTKFLMECSEKNVNFLEMSKKAATKDNVAKFFTTGEKLTWPDNWKQYPNKAGKLAKKSEEMRNQFLLDRPSGVYVAGSGHLKELMMLDRSLVLIGGEQILEEEHPMLKMDPHSFDQSREGWRSLPRYQQEPVLRSYIGKHVGPGGKFNKGTPGGDKNLSSNTLRWHLGQVQAMAGKKGDAVKNMERSRDHDPQSNRYVGATTSFLKGDKSGFDKNVAASDKYARSSGERGQDRTNRKIVTGLKKAGAKTIKTHIN